MTHSGLVHAVDEFVAAGLGKDVALALAGQMGIQGTEALAAMSWPELKARLRETAGIGPHTIERVRLVHEALSPGVRADDGSVDRRAPAASAPPGTEENLLGLMEQLVARREALCTVTEDLARREVEAERLRLEISRLEAELEGRRLAAREFVQAALAATVPERASGKARRMKPPSG